MNDLVEMINGEARTTSNLIGEEFGVAHKELLRKLDNLAVEISPLRFGKMYVEGVRDTRGRSYKNYSISRDGYMFLVMNISTKAANSKKLAFIDAFNDMDAHISGSETFMSKINSAINMLEGDKEKASVCASGLSAWKKIKKQRESEVKKLINQAQLILKLEPEL
jgi:Rha family phage regulatory protein